MPTRVDKLWLKTGTVQFEMRQRGWGRDWFLLLQASQGNSSWFHVKFRRSSTFSMIPCDSLWFLRKSMEILGTIWIPMGFLGLWYVVVRNHCTAMGADSHGFAPAQLIRTAAIPRNPTQHISGQPALAPAEPVVGSATQIGWLSFEALPNGADHHTASWSESRARECKGV